MHATIHHADTLRGTLTLPPDKAICHRAVLAAALASGNTEISPWPSADDCQHTLALIQGLGVTVRRVADRLQIMGQGRVNPPAQELFCGESGTTFRLAAGLLAGQPFTSRLSAASSLSRRPMQRIVVPLTQMGARCEATTTGPGSRECYPPITIHGKRPLTAIRYQMDVASAQVKSAILLAGLFANGRTTVVEAHPTRDHTERTLRYFGVRVHTDGPTVLLEPGPLSSPGRLIIPGDVSSAAFFLVAACCVSGSQLTLQGVGLNPTRLGMLKVLARMGAEIRVTVTDDRWEPRGTIQVESRPLRGTVVTSEEAPGLIDELPILMVAAACAQGTTRFEGVGELRVKETDRIASMVAGLQRLGANIRLPTPDTVELEGGPLIGAELESAGDHRTAMSLAVAGLVAGQRPTTVRGAECVSKSFPEFFDALRQIVGAPTVKTVDKA